MGGDAFTHSTILTKRPIINLVFFFGILHIVRVKKWNKGRIKYLNLRYHCFMLFLSVHAADNQNGNLATILQTHVLALPVS